MSVKTYTVSYNSEGRPYDLVLKVDEEKFTPEVQAEMNNFWSRADERLDAAGGNLLHAVLKLICGQYFTEAARCMSAVDEFNAGRVEGFVSLDGKYGVKFIRADEFGFDADDMSITEKA